MTNEELIEATKELIAIQSSGDNRKALDEALEYVANFVRKRNPRVTIEYFERNGIRSFLAYRSKKRPEGFHIILNGHVDVVPGKTAQYKAKVKDGKLYGRGAHDMKAACIIMAEVFCEFVNDVPYELGLQIVTDEETGGFDGTCYQVQQGVRSDFTVCGECGRKTDVYEVANEAKGLMFVDVEFHGKTAHGAYPWRGENAAIKATHFAKAVYDLHPTPQDEHHDRTITVTGIISDTGVHNKVPDHAIVKLDIRFLANDSAFESQGALEAFIRSIDPNVKAIAVRTAAPPAYADPNGEFMQDLKRAAEVVEGKEFKFVRRHASSDGRHYMETGGQACEFGVAGEDQHGDEEHITLKAFENYHATMRQFLRNTRVPGQLPLKKGVSAK